MVEKKNNSSYRLDWETVKNDWPIWILLAGLLITAVWVYPHLPERIPSHWNIHGEVDGYQSRLMGAIFTPLMATALYWLMVLLPIIDPKRDNYRRFAGAYTFLRWSLVMFFAVMYAATIMVALGYSIDIGMLVKAIISILFIIIGNFMGQFRHNYFVGIKTPWTLANEEVWQRTHRFGGKIWVLCGLICLAMAFVNSTWSEIVFFTALIIIIIVPVVYSYLIFVKIEAPK